MAPPTLMAWLPRNEQPVTVKWPWLLMAPLLPSPGEFWKVSPEKLTLDVAGIKNNELVPPPSNVTAPLPTNAMLLGTVMKCVNVIVEFAPRLKLNVVPGAAL